MLRRFLTVLLLLPAVASCDDDEAIAPKVEAPPGPNAPKLAIVDGSNGGADVFRWQPPMVPTADPQGTFDAAAQPVVEICVQAPASA